MTLTVGRSFPQIFTGTMIVYHYEREGRVCLLFAAKGCTLRYHCRVCNRLHERMNDRDECETSHQEPPCLRRAWPDEVWPGPEEEWWRVPTTL